MPLYEYQCGRCGRFELIKKFSDPPVTDCPTCGQEVQKLFSAPAIQFKGTGWYITDYARKSDGKDGAAKDGGGKDGGAKDGTSKAKESGKDGGATASNGSSSSASKDSGSTSKDSGGKSKDASSKGSSAAGSG